ncbi:protein timeless homolog [Ischnura elegans]|uniref:protein timeless homolog n=1 Tax=Ischnura elegans TaxID=197161 RepID=UPI001ED87C93|nr:protein timeless homolog [Ischnura elegans]
MSSLLFAELAATCNALGYFDGIKYHKDVHCLETIKDLIRYLRRDDDSHEIRRYLGDANIVKTDLIPIFKDYSDDKYLFEVLLRLLVNLTNPVLVLFREELPEDKTTRNYYLKMIGHLQAYKEAFVDETVWTILGKKLGDILQVEWQERDEDMNMSIMRILTLARNTLQVPADTMAEKRPDNDASLHDQILWAIHVSGLVDIFLYIACSENEEQYYMHILEIISQMLREQNPTQLAVAAAQRSASEQIKDECELMAIRDRETQARREKMRKFASARHSRFLGTYCVKNVQSISDRELIYHRPLNKLESLNLDRDKRKLKHPKNRLPLKDDNPERRSAFSIRLFLKEFCVEFLNGAYNNLMYRVKCMITGGETQENDETYYLWAMKFFMEFNRCYKFRVELVSETISVQTFHFVQTQIENYFEMMTVDKKKIPIWSRRLHLAVKSYQELLNTLGAMSSSTDQKIKDSAQVLMSNIFYVVEYRELCLTLLMSYLPQKMSTSCLQDIIKTVHIFMKLLESHCKANRTILVQKKTAKRKKKKTKTSGAQNTDEAQAREKTLEEQWEEIGPELSAVLQGGIEIPGDIIPFDATSDVSIDDQRADAMRKIQDHLRQHKTEEAVGLLRAAREVWPENDYFGNSLMAPEDEFMAFREIYFADIKKSDDNVATAEPSEEPNAAEDNNPSYSEDEEEEGVQYHNASAAEQSFNFKEFVLRFAKTRVIQPCAFILRDFKTNPLKVNHCVLRLMHRIAVECNLPALFFQASLFRTFQKILEEYRYAASRRSNSSSVMGEREKDIKEMAKFAVFILRKFAEVAKKNPKIFMEILFWKTSRDAQEVVEGYGSYQEKSASAKAVWTEEQEDEIRRLYEEFSVKGLPDGDLVDAVHSNMIDADRSKRAVKKKMKMLGLITSTKSTKSRPPKEWAEEEIEELTSLYGEMKDAIDPIGQIGLWLTVKRPKHRIIEKLLDLGLASSRSELYKKRSKGASSKSDSKGYPEHKDLSSGDESSSSEEENNDHIVKPKRPENKNKMPRNTKSSGSNFSTAGVVNAIKTAINSGYSEALEWLMESLNEAAEDEGEESVPLLPISENAILAMEDANFLKVLMLHGIVEPDGEQEVYWRIPPHFKPRDLRTRAQAIEMILKNKDAEVPAPGESSTGAEMDVTFSSLLSECDPMISSGPKSKGQKRKSRKQSSSSSGEEDLENFFKTVRKGNESDIMFGQKEDLQNPNTSFMEDKVGDTSVALTQKKKKRLVIHDESSSDEEMNETNLADRSHTSSVPRLVSNGMSSVTVTTNEIPTASANKKNKKILALKDDTSSDDEGHIVSKPSEIFNNDDVFSSLIANSSNANNNTSSGSQHGNPSSENSSNKFNRKKNIIDDSSSDDEALSSKSLRERSDLSHNTTKSNDEVLPIAVTKKKKRLVVNDDSSSEEDSRTTQEIDVQSPFEKVGDDTAEKLPSNRARGRVQALLSDDEDE